MDVPMFKAFIDFLHKLWVQKPISKRKNHTAMNSAKSEVIYN